jgi:hypothetical protein
MPLSIEQLKARLAATKIKGRTGNFLRLDTDKPVVCFILPGNDSLWFRQIGTHWLDKNRVNCASPDGEGSCYICDMIKLQKEELAEAKKQHEDDSPSDAAENATVFTAMEESIRRITARRAFAFNILVRGEETPKTFEAPWMIFNTIYTMFNSAVNDYAIDITDPHESTSFTLVKTGSGKNGTRYSASPAPRGIPLFSGEGAEAKIEQVLSKMLDLDKHYAYPEKTELITAWNAYTNGEEAPKTETKTATSAPVRTAPPKTPPSMSRIGGKPISVKPPPPPEPEPDPEPEDPQDEAQEIAGGNGNGHTEEEPTEEPAPATIPTKHQAAAASNKILTRLRGNK